MPPPLQPPSRLAICVLALVSSCLPGRGATFISRILFDDYRDAFDTSGITPVPPPGMLQVFAAHPTVTVTTTLTNPDTAGALRQATLTIDPVVQLIGVSAFVDPSPPSGRPSISIGADPSTAGTLILEYDFTTLAGGAVDALTGNSHLSITADGDSNPANALLEFVDGGGNRVSKNLELELGVDLTKAGVTLVPFTSFSGVDFSAITRMTLTWEAGAAYDGQIATVGAGLLPNDPPPPPAHSPEPGYVMPLLTVWMWSAQRRRRES